MGGTTNFCQSGADCDVAWTSRGPGCAMVVIRLHDEDGSGSGTAASAYQDVAIKDNNGAAPVVLPAPGAAGFAKHWIAVACSDGSRESDTFGPVYVSTTLAPTPSPTQFVPYPTPEVSHGVAGTIGLQGVAASTVASTSSAIYY